MGVGYRKVTGGWGGQYLLREQIGCSVAARAAIRHLPRAYPADPESLEALTRVTEWVARDSDEVAR